MRNVGVLGLVSKTHYPYSLTHYVLRMIGLYNHQRLAVLYGLGVLDQDAGYAARKLRLYLVHHLHGLDDAHGLAQVYRVVLTYIGRLAGGWGRVEGAHHGGHQQLLAFLQCNLFAMHGAVTYQIDYARGLRLRRHMGRSVSVIGMRARRHATALDGDAHRAALQVQLADVAGRYEAQ